MDAEGIRIALGENLSVKDQEEITQAIKAVNKQLGGDESEDCLSFELFVLHMK